MSAAQCPQCGRDHAARRAATAAAVSPWVRRADSGCLPHNVYASAHTDARAHVVRETVADILRRTMPKGR